MLNFNGTVAFEEAIRFKYLVSCKLGYCFVWQVRFNKGNVLIDVFRLRIFLVLSHAIIFSFYKPKTGLHQGFFRGVFFPDMNKKNSSRGDEGGGDSTK